MVTLWAQSGSMELGQHIQSYLSGSSAWLSAHWLQLLLAVAAGLLLVLGLRLLRTWSTKLCERGDRGAGWGVIAGRAAARTTNFFIVMTAARLVAGYAAAPEPVGRTVGVLFTVAAAFQGAIWAREFILGAIELRTASEHHHGDAMLNAMGLIRVLVSTVLFAIALVVVLDNLGVNVTGLVAGLGVGGIAIGLAAQGIFADLFAALAIIFDQPFRRGDNIQFDQSSGTIEQIGLKSTRIRAFTGEERIISNRALLDKEILNTTRRNHIRIRLPLSIDCRTPSPVLSRLPELIREIVTRHGGVPARVGYGGVSEGALAFELEFDSPGSDWDVAHAARDQILIAILERLELEDVDLGLATRKTIVAGASGGGQEETAAA